MTSSLEEGYFEWLAGQIRNPNHSALSKTYWDVTKLMHDVEFEWQIPNDDNRMSDGHDLRIEYCREVLDIVELDDIPEIIWRPSVSFCEVLVGLSRRVAFATDGSADVWAWHLFTNLHLDKFSDPLSKAKTVQAEEILEKVIFREYLPDGDGGFFPLAFPTEDQREVEIWAQMGAYLEELPPH